MHSQRQSSINTVLSLRIPLPTPLCLQDILFLDSTHLALIFESHYAKYNTSTRQLLCLTPLSCQLECLRLTHQGVIGINLQRTRLILINCQTGEEVRSVEIKRGSTFSKEDVEIIVLEESELVMVIFREKFMLLKKIIVMDRDLSILSTLQLKIPFLSKYDQSNLLINWTQRITNFIKLSWLNIETHYLNSTQLNLHQHHFPAFEKYQLTVVKRVNQQQCILGINDPVRSRWYIFDLQKQTLTHCFSGHSILDSIKVENTQCNYFGYDYSQQRPRTLLVTFDYLTSEWNSDQVPLFPGSSANYQDSSKLVFYSPNTKPKPQIEVTVMGSISKRAMILHLVLKSHVSEFFGTGILEHLFRVTDFAAIGNNALQETEEVIVVFNTSKDRSIVQ